MFKNFDITFSMSFMPAFMLSMCRSVEMESGVKPCFIGGNRLAKRKASAAMADIENDAALACFEQIGQQLAVLIQHGHRGEIRVRVDIAGPQMFETRS